MTIRLTFDKKQKIKDLILEILNEDRITIRKVACILGKLISSLPASQFGALYYRYLENDKISALKNNFGDFDKLMTLSDDAKNDLKWWLTNLPTLSAPIRLKPIVLTMSCDASNKGWGGST